LSANTSLALGALTLAGGDTVFTAPTISTGTINGGGFSLALNGASSVGATVADSVTNLTSLNLNGNSNVYAGNLSLPTITGSGTVTFINPVTLSENLAVSGTSLAFQGNITGPAYTLTLTGPTTLGSTGAEVVNLATLTANSPLTLDLASITTSGNQLYNVPVNLMSNVTLNPSGNTVTFGANVNANNNNLTIDGAATLGNVTYSNLNTLDITGPTQLNVASLTASTDISLGATTLGGGNTVLTAPTIGVGSVNGGGSSSLTLNGASTVGSSGADSVTGLTSLALNGNSNVLAGTLSLPTITGAGSMNFQNPVNLLAPIVIDTSNQNVTFFSPISGGQNMTFALGTGNLAFNGEGISTIGNVLVNSVGNLSVVNSGTLDVTGFTQSAGTGFSNFGNTLDAGPNNVNVTTNGTISGTVIGNILNFHSNDGSVDVNATANSMMIFAATGSNTTGCVNGVCAVEGNPTMVPALTIEPGSGGTNFFNGLELGVFTPSVTPNPFGTDALYFELFARDYNTQSIDLEYYKTNPSDSDDEDTYQRNFQGLFADADSDGSCQASGGQAQGSS